MPLKELQAKNAKPREKAFKLADEQGLYLLVRPNGSKLWRMKYRYEGKEKLLSFGSYPSVGLAAAREKRLNAKHLLSEGKDPMGTSADFRTGAEHTFRAIAKIWHENREFSLDPDHACRVWSRLKRDVFPIIGDKSMESISPPDVLSIIRKIEARGALDISRRAKQSVGQVFQFAIASGWASTDPTTHLRGALKPKPRVKHMSKLPMAELPRFLVKLDGYKEECSRRSTVTKDAVTFTLLTWVRTIELRFAEKIEFEGLGTENPLWRIPETRMKMKREHLIPLSRQAAEIAERMIAASSSDFLFPGVKLMQPLSENTMIYALYRLGYIGRQTIHGLRGLASTWANEQLIEFGDPVVWMRKYHEDWVEKQLAHEESNEVRGAYNSAEYFAPRQRMLQDWANFIETQRESGLAALRKEFGHSLSVRLAASNC
jgi:integrase